MLTEHVARRQEDLEKYDDAPDLSESGEILESDCPVLQKFFEENGTRAIMDMTNFTFNEFTKIWNHISEHVQQHYNTGRGIKSPIKAKDLVFITFEVLRHGAKWDTMANLFGMKAPTFKKRINKMNHIISDYAYQKFVVHYEQRYTMSRLIAEKKAFRKIQMCRYASDVTFQQSFRPGGSLQE